MMAGVCAKKQAFMDEHTAVYEKPADHLDRLPQRYPRTATGLEIRILRKLFTPEQASLAQLLTLDPEPPAGLAARSGPAPEDLGR